MMIVEDNLSKIWGLRIWVMCHSLYIEQSKYIWVWELLSKVSLESL